MDYLKLNQKDNKNFIEEVMQKIIKNTDFIKYYDNNTLEDWAIEEKTIDYLCGIGIDITCGSTRITIIPKNKNFVFKIYLGSYDEDDSDYNINDIEYRRYLKSSSNIFAECYLEDINLLDFSISVLVVEKCFPLDNLVYEDNFLIF